MGVGDLASSSVSVKNKLFKDVFLSGVEESRAEGLKLSLVFGKSMSKKVDEFFPLRSSLLGRDTGVGEDGCSE